MNQSNFVYSSRLVLSRSQCRLSKFVFVNLWLTVSQTCTFSKREGVTNNNIYFPSDCQETGYSWLSLKQNQTLESQRASHELVHHAHDRRFSHSVSHLCTPIPPYMAGWLVNGGQHKVSVSLSFAALAARQLLRHCPPLVWRDLNDHNDCLVIVGGFKGETNLVRLVCLNS